MSKSMVNILVACGSGVATSTVAQEAVRDICKENGINAKIVKCTMSEIPSKEDDVDLILVTTNYRKKASKPVLKVFGLISGIGMDKITADIVAACKQVMES